MKESFLWAFLKMTGRETDGATVPVRADLWLLGYRAAVGVASWLAVWVIMGILQALPMLGALVGTAAVLVLWLFSGVSVRNGEYVLSQLVVPASGDARHDQNRRQVAYAILLAVRPVCMFFLCLRHDMLWFVPVLVLAGCVSPDSVSATGLRVPVRRDQWWFGIGAALLAGIVLRLGSGRPGWIILVILASLAAYFLPPLISARLAGGTAVQTMRRAVVLYGTEVLLLAVGLLETVF